MILGYIIKSELTYMKTLKNLKEGQAISSFVKNSNVIWEGILIEKEDGTKVVLNEETHRWKKLSDLEHVKVLNEDANAIKKGFDSFGEMVDSSFKDLKGIDSNKITDQNIKQLAKDFQEVSKSYGIKDTPKDDKEAGEIVTNALASKYAQENATSSAGNAQQAEEAKKNIESFKKEVQESLNRLHPSLRLSESDQLEDLEDYWDFGGLEDSEHLKNSENYEDDFQYDDEHYNDEQYDDENDIDDFLYGRYDDDPEGDPEGEPEDDFTNSLSKEDEEKALEKALDLIRSNSTDILKEIIDEFDIPEKEADKIVELAMEEYLDSENSGESMFENDEIEDDFEKTIDAYDGPDDGLLDHLINEYEIDPEEAEVVWEETDGNLEECIFAFVDIVKRRIR